LVRKTSDLSLLEGMKIRLHYGDVTQPDTLVGAMQGYQVLIHNAGFASDWGSLDTFLRINYEGTQHIAKAAEQSGVQRMVLMSSTAIHGFGSAIPLGETAPVNPQGFHYSISKAKAEEWLMLYGKTSRMEVTAIRPGNVFGTRDHTFIEKYLDVIMRGQGGYVNGGRSKTCPVYVENLAHGVSLACFHPAAVGEAFLITDGLDITWRQFTELLATEAKVALPRLSIPYPIGNALAGAMEWVYRTIGSKKAPLLTRYRMSNGGIDYHFSIDKARKVLGYEPLVGLEEALRQTVEWYVGSRKE
jgi:nucleoside-diphosphate-sugar epimerase